MKTTAVRLYGKEDLRLETFALPPTGKDEILARIVCDSLCMSSYKAAKQGALHKRVPDDVAENPVMLGHEFCGEILEVGEHWKGTYTVGDRFVIQPALNYKGTLDAPGYSFAHIGGDATHVLIPPQVMQMDCLLPFHGDAWFHGSLTEPISCVVGAFHANYHAARGSYEHNMGIREGGAMAILAGAGPMGLAAIEYILHCDRRPGLLLVTDLDPARLARAEQLLSPAHAAKNGVTLHYILSNDTPREQLLQFAPEGFDDVMVFAPVKSVVELGDSVLATDGCLNFFAGPTDPEFRALFNFYNVHYNNTHIVGTSGGNADDMRESLMLMQAGVINPAILVTHIGGLDCVIDTTLTLPQIPGGKKLIYTNISLPLCAIDDFAALGEHDPLFAELHAITQNAGGLWCAEAERYLLANAKPL